MTDHAEISPFEAGDFSKIARRVLPSRYIDHREYLYAVYHELKASRDAYSYREYSVDTGFGNCTAMHLIVHGQRTLTLKGASKIADAIGLTGDERAYFLALPAYVNAKNPSAKDLAFSQLMRLKTRLLPGELDRKYLEFYSHWYNTAILEILRVPQASDDPDWIADRLVPRVPPQRVAKALTLLTDLGFLAKDPERGRLAPTDFLVTSGPEVQSMALVSFHQQMIDLAKASLSTVAQLERDVSGLTFSTTVATKVRIKEEVVMFRRRLIDLLEADSSRNHRTGEMDSEILQLHIMLFPLAQGLRKFEKA